MFVAVFEYLAALAGDDRLFAIVSLRSESVLFSELGYVHGEPSGVQAVWYIRTSIRFRLRLPRLKLQAAPFRSAGRMRCMFWLSCSSEFSWMSERGRIFLLPPAMETTRGHVPSSPNFWGRCPLAGAKSSP